MYETIVSAAQTQGDLRDSRMLFEKAVVRMNAAIWRLTDLQRTREWSHPTVKSACVELAAHREKVRSTLKDFRAAVLHTLFGEQQRIRQQRDTMTAELETLARLH